MPVRRVKFYFITGTMSWKSTELILNYTVKNNQSYAFPNAREEESSRYALICC